MLMIRFVSICHGHVIDVTLWKTQWVPEITHHCQKTPFLLVGTQIDLRDENTTLEKLAKNKQKPITMEQGEKLAKELKAVKFVECSALTQVRAQISRMCLSRFPFNWKLMYSYRCVAFRVTIHRKDWRTYSTRRFWLHSNHQSLKRSHAANFYKEQQNHTILALLNMFCLRTVLISSLWPGFVCFWCALEDAFFLISLYRHRPKQTAALVAAIEKGICISIIQIFLNISIFFLFFILKISKILQRLPTTKSKEFGTGPKYCVSFYVITIANKFNLQ